MKKPIISIIAAVGEDLAIGKNNQLLWDIPTDLQHFKKVTSGHPVIMGERTFLSIGRLLPNRINIIFTVGLLAEEIICISMQNVTNYWNTIKKETHSKQSLPLFVEREVWWCALGVNIGNEEDGKGQNYLRPVLVLRKFNKSIFYGLPITSNNKDDIFHAAISSGEVQGSVILSQMRLVDAKRLSHILGKITGNELGEVKKKLKGLFS